MSSVQRSLMAVAGLSAAAFFGLDLLLPLGVAAGLPYVAVVLLGIWFPRRRDIFALAGLATVLTVLGYFLSPEGGVPWMTVANRLLTLFAIWITAFLIALRKQAETASRRAETQFQTVVATAVDGIIIIDARGTVLVMNPAAERIFGYGAEEVIGHNVKMLMPEPYHSEHDGYLERYHETDERRIIGIGREVTGLRRDGSTFPMDLAVGTGWAVGEEIFTGFVRDITERKESETRVRQLHGELHHITRFSAMGEMGSALAHELNQPLTALTNYVRAAQRTIRKRATDVDDKVHDWMDQSVTQAARASKVIERLREFVRKGETDKAFEDLNAVIEEVLSLALVGTRADGITVERHLANGLPRVLIDRIQIQQVLLNLVRNSIDALSDRDRREIAIVSSARGDRDVVLEVRDTGPGLPPNVLERLFQPFVTTKEDGMGIGLSVCHSIITAHGGEIIVTENPGGGAIFQVSIPTGEEYGSDDA